MNPGDKVVITRGTYNGYAGELIEYKQQTKWSTPFCRVKIPGFNLEVYIDPWDLEPYEEYEEEELNEADTTSASNM